MVIETAGTYELDGTTFDNSGTKDIYVSASSGTVNINITGGGDIPDYDTAGATVNIKQPVTVKVTVKDAEDLSLVENARVLLTADAPTTTGGDLPFEESVTIVRSGSTATVTHNTHGLATGDKVVIYGANQPEYLGIRTITVSDTNTYTYTVSGTPATPATGTITSTAVILDGATNASGIVQDTAFNYTSDQPVTGVVRRGTSSPFYKTSSITGDITISGFTSTVLMIVDE
jgi:hypothetical protein